MMQWGGQADARAIMRRLDQLIGGFETHPDPQVRAGVLELLQGVDALHREGLSRLLDRIRESCGTAPVEQAQADPVVRLLLGLYDLAELELPPETDGPADPANGPQAPASPAGPAPEPRTSADSRAGGAGNARQARPPAGPVPAFVPLERVRKRTADS